MEIEERIQEIRQKMARAAIAAGRKPEDITLCAATKMNDAAAVRRAIAAGVDCCGENRVQEMVAKMEEHAYDGAPLHFIGRLQTNKVRQVVGKAALIQSVDRMKLLQAIDQEAGRQGICQHILLEVNVGGEESKGGFAPEELPVIFDKIGQFENVFIDGLMTIPPVSQNPGDNVKFFQEILQFSVDIRRKKYDNVRIGILSMGMTDDYEDAIACGSTMVRIGSGIFGPRNYAKPHL